MTETAYYAAPDAVCLDVSGPASARIYRACRVERTVLGERATIGDFSRVGDSVLGENAFLQRDNLAYFLRLGRYSYTGRNTVIWHAEVGAFCSISWNVSIGGANHDFTRLTTHSFLYDDKDFGLMPEGAAGYDRFSEPCAIGSDVWIGAGACILRGVTVGTGAVIGAGAVVTRDIPPYTVAVGVPARPVKQRFSDEVVRRLLDTAWWELPGEVIRANYPLFNAQPDGEGLTRLEDLSREFRRTCP